MRLFIEVRLNDLLLGHLAVRWNLGLLHHLPQRLILLSQLVDLHTHLIPDGFNKCFRVGLNPLHLHPYHLVLLLQVLEVSQGAVDVVLVLVFFSGKGNVRWLLG